MKVVYVASGAGQRKRWNAGRRLLCAGLGARAPRPVEGRGRRATIGPLCSSPDKSRREDVRTVAKRTKSALKANRQNIKRREHNRRCARSSAPALKAIRASLDAKDVTAPRRRSARPCRSSTRWRPRASSTATRLAATSHACRARLAESQANARLSCLARLLSHIPRPAARAGSGGRRPTTSGRCRSGRPRPSPAGSRGRQPLRRRPQLPQDHHGTIPPSSAGPARAERLAHVVPPDRVRNAEVGLRLRTRRHRLSNIVRR